MTTLEWMKHRWGEFKALSAKTGYSPLRLYLSYKICEKFHGASYEHFVTFRMFDDTNRKRSQYLTITRCREVESILHANATEADILAMENKYQFNTGYAEFIRRDWLYIPDSTPDQLRAFALRNRRFLAKDCESTQGKGVRLFEVDENNVDEFLLNNGSKPYLLEAFIQQHPAMAAPNPTSVNTLRITTARYHGKLAILGCCMRVGGANQFVDNFHNGGVAYPVDLESGVVVYPGKGYMGERVFFRHPGTEYPMLGLKIPHWDMVMEGIQQIASKPENLGLIGWDVAVTEDGIDFIEANIGLPSPTLLQLYGPGVYQQLKDLIANN